MSRRNEITLTQPRYFAAAAANRSMTEAARELCGGQICITPDAATFASPDVAPWLRKFYTVNDDWAAEDRRRLLAFGRDLLNSDYAGHRLTFQLFAQSPPFAQLAAVYRNFDRDGPLGLAKAAAGLSDAIDTAKQPTPAKQEARFQWRTTPASGPSTRVTPTSSRPRQRPLPGRRRQRRGVPERPGWPGPGHVRVRQRPHDVLAGGLRRSHAIVRLRHLFFLARGGRALRAPGGRRGRG